MKSKMAMINVLLFGVLVASIGVTWTQLYRPAFQVYYNACSYRYYGVCRARCLTRPVNEYNLGQGPCANGLLGTCCAPSLHCSLYGGTCKYECDRTKNEGEYRTQVYCLTPGMRCCMQASAPASSSPTTASTTTPTTTPSSSIATRRQPTCGRSGPAPRISNGYVSIPCEWPWMVSINLGGRFLCSGVLIDSRTVITTAQCVSPVQSTPTDLRLTVGDYDTDNTDVYEVTSSVSSITIHPGYNPNNRNALSSSNNIALLRLPLAVRLQQSCVQPVCLPRAGYFPNAYDRCFIAGWGETNGFRNGQLQAASVRTVGINTCNNFIESSTGSTISSDKVCSMPAADNADACFGDTGGMLVCPEVFQGQRRFVLLGLIDAFDANCAGSVRNNRPTIYTNVVSHLSWIQNNM